MKKAFKVSILATIAVLTVACSKETQAAKVDLTKKDQKVAYAVGSSFGQQLSGMLKQQTELGMPLNKEVVLQGIIDTLHEKGQLTSDQINETLTAYGKEVQATVAKQAKEKAEKVAKEGNAFLAQNAKKDGVTVTKSGLQYSIIKKATGPKPKADDTVTVHYVGTLIDGTEFDSSIKRGQPATFPLNRVIPGWTEGLQLMSVGEKFKFVIPAKLAYGDQSAGKIPAGATLIFNVELLGIKDKTPAAK